MLDNRTEEIQTEPAPENPETKHVGVRAGSSEETFQLILSQSESDACTPIPIKIARRQAIA